MISAKDLSISSTAYKKEMIEKPEIVDPSKFLEKLPFDTGLALKESERRAKMNVPLPYVAAQEEEGEWTIISWRL